MQRHHLLPCQLLRTRCFAPLFEAVGFVTIGYHDFRANGLLLPGSDSAAARSALPLHRGPHPVYNEMVMERVGRIEASWMMRRRTAAFDARVEAAMRLRVLQGALRRRLLDPARRPIALNRRQLVVEPLDFSDLDAMAELLWGATG